MIIINNEIPPLWIIINDTLKDPVYSFLIKQNVNEYIRIYRKAI